MAHRLAILPLCMLLVGLLLPTAAAQEGPPPECDPSTLVADAAFFVDGELQSGPDALANVSAGSVVQAVLDIETECVAVLALVAAQSGTDVVLDDAQDVEVVTDAEALVYLTVTVPECIFELSLLASVDAAAEAMANGTGNATGNATADLEADVLLQVTGGEACEGQDTPTAPPCPANQRIETQGEALVLSFTTPEGVDGVSIYRAEAGGEFELVTEMGPEASGYADGTVEVGVAYTYIVVAHQAGVESDLCPLQEATATPDLLGMALVGAGLAGVLAYGVARRRK